MNPVYYTYLLIACCLFASGCQEEPEIPLAEPSAYVYQPELFALRGDGEVKLTWGWFTWDETNLSYVDPESFSILISEDEGDSWRIHMQVGGETSSLTISGLTNASLYSFAIEARAQNAQASLSNSIQLVPQAQAELTDMFEGMEGDRFWGSFSSVGDILAYTKVLGNEHFIYRYLIAEQKEVQVYVGDFADFAPIGDRLAFVSGIDNSADIPLDPSSIYTSILLDSENGLNTLGETNASQREVAWAPDGQSLFVLSDYKQEGSYAIWKINADSRLLPTVISSPLDLPLYVDNPLDRSPRNPIWNADGTHVLYTRFVEDDSLLIRNIVSTSVNGGAEDNVLSSAWNDFAPALSRDGNRLAFVSDRSGINAIWIKELDTGALTQVTGSSSLRLATPDDLRLDWHPDGGSLLFTSLRSDDSRTLMRVWIE